MTSLKSTLQNLQRYKKLSANLKADFGRMRPEGAETSGWLKEVSEFGPNPGQLQMLTYQPQGAVANSAIVVVLHGCTQTSAGYASHVGWRELADRYKFRLLCPQQSRQNNGNGCFNWFQPADVARKGGECQSIHSMIQHMSGKSKQKPLVYVTGLSAGGAMACAMLATYPEVFAGGSIISGLPFGAADDVPSAFAAMHQPKADDARLLGERVRNASRHVGPWPTVAIWHGDADKTVLPANGTELCKQWIDVHRLGETDPQTRGARTEWRDSSGKVVVTYFVIEGMGHGAPIDSRGPGACGSAAPYVLEAGISSSLTMAQAWGLAGANVYGLVLNADGDEFMPQTGKAEHRREAEQTDHHEHQHGAFIQRTIHAALKSAGLIKS